ncbi:hypothetical protein D3C85_959840 [compost metagenome]
MLAALAFGVVGLQFTGQQRLFVVREPLGLLEAVGQRPEGQDAEQHAGNGLQQEQPLPALQAVDQVEVAHDPAGQRAADDAGQRQADHEQGDDPPAPVSGEPHGQVVEDTGQETGFGGAEEEAQDIELRRGGDEHGAGREQAPGDHDAGDPQLGADLLQHQVARHFEEDVADEEQAGSKAVGRLAELQVFEHLQLGEADVDAVEVGGQIAEAQEGDEPPGDLAIELLGSVASHAGGGGCIRERHCWVSWR